MISMRARRRLVLPVAAVLVCGGAAAASAQWMDNEPLESEAGQSDLPGGPVLHEYVAPPGSSGSSASAANKPKTLGGDPQAGKNPWGVRSRDKILPEPRKDQKPAPAEPVMGTNDFAADRDTSANPDYATGADSTLHYVEVFNPAVVPFKRMSALDAVDDNYMLRVYDQQLAELPVGGKSTSDRDLFWASLMVQLRPGEDVPIPSTAPDMRIMSYEVDPPVELIFSKDGADNYFVRSNDSNARGVFRLVFLSDAPATYFAAAVPRGYTIADASASGLVRPVPPRVQRAAQIVLEKIGVTSKTPLDVALDRLVEYFRRFEAGEAPPRTEDIYLDLALSRRGVCRHRAFAFVVTANALGIPARYVTNEAHAFAEVKVPEIGWIRVDLGGAALNLDVANAGDKQMYRPRNTDPFPKPPEYADNYTQLRGDIKGLSKDQINQVRDPGAGNGRDPGSTDPVSPSPGVGLPAPPPAAYQGKLPTHVVVDGVSGDAYRGESVRVGGQLTSENGTPLANVPVNVYLAPAGRGGDGARLLGETVTDASGRFEADIDLPHDLALGRHEVYASTPGDARHQPALSQ